MLASFALEDPSPPISMPPAVAQQNASEQKTDRPAGAQPEQAVELTDDEGHLLLVRPRAPHAMRMSWWQLGNRLAAGACGAGLILVALSGFAFFKSKRAFERIGQARTGQSAHLRDGWMLLSGIAGTAALTASIMFYAMSPERKHGPRGQEWDPRLLPHFDKHCAWMQTQPVPRSLLDKQGGAREVPRIIHQIWFGDASKIRNRDAAWRAYAARFGYDYHLYTEQDLPNIALSANNRRIVAYELAHGDYWCASDIVRYAVLAARGGIYVDMDMHPPRRDGDFVELSAMIHPRGLTLMTEEFGRDCDAQSALFVANGLISAPAQDATMVHALATLPTNWASVNQHARSELTAGGIAMCHAMFVSGPFFLSRLLNGTPQILSFREAAQMGVVNADVQ